MKEKALLLLSCSVLLASCGSAKTAVCGPFSANQIYYDIQSEEEQSGTASVNFWAGRVTGTDIEPAGMNDIYRVNADPKYEDSEQDLYQIDDLHFVLTSFCYQYEDEKHAKTANQILLKCFDLRDFGTDAEKYGMTIKKDKERPCALGDIVAFHYCYTDFVSVAALPYDEGVISYYIGLADKDEALYGCFLGPGSNQLSFVRSGEDIKLSVVS